MENKDLRGFILDDKPVYDWNRFRLGTVADLRRDPKTRETRQLVVTLSAEAKAQMGTREDIVEIPVDYIFGIRKDAVSLDRSVGELSRLEVAAGLLRR
ncbi:MAG: hypothetical protein ACYDCK_08010 [Thermoplasmatota archaeon]